MAGRILMGNSISHGALHEPPELTSPPVQTCAYLHPTPAGAKELAQL
ncbi:MAG: hypothetical protein M0P33_07285 [Massilibacteroides sp.]|nr:hypothetical protein [Massilibacteroides sp.]